MSAKFLPAVVPAMAALLQFGCSSEPPAAREATRTEPVRIVHFYASPGIVTRGEPVTMCYGVENALAVRVEPAVEPLTPSPNRCIQFAPDNTAKYKLTATGAGGREVSQSIEVSVQAARPKQAAARPEPKRQMILLFVASANQIGRSQPVTLCYGVRNASSVRLEPDGRALEPLEKSCFMVSPAQTTTYTLVASGEGNHTEREKLTITVN